MRHFPLNELSESEFEDIIVAICRELLGVGVTGFSPGPDGGKDGHFEGTANRFPSDKEPAIGKFVIQAKHAQSAAASCSDSSFKKTLLDKELPKVKRLFEKGDLTHYLFFTNRKKTAGADEHFTKRVRDETGLNEAWLLGLDYIERELRSHPQIVRNAGLDRFRLPLEFTPEDYHDIIEGLFNHRDEIETSFDSEHDFKDYPGFDGKNRINGVSSDYSELIRDASMPHFDSIERFLKNPRNQTLKEKFHVVANELKSQLIVHRERFDSFEHTLEAIPILIQDRTPLLQVYSRRRLLKIMIHYMYVDCEIGKKS